MDVNKKKEEREILNIFLNSNFGLPYRNKNISETESPDFIIGNEGFEITKITDEDGLKEHDSYIKFCKYIEKEIKKKFGEEYSINLSIRYRKNIKYNRIKKIAITEIIRIIENNREAKEIQLDFYRDYNLHKNPLFKYFDYLTIEKYPTGIYIGPGREMSKFSELYEKCIVKKEKKQYSNQNIESVNLIIFCWYDTIFTENEINRYKSTFSSSDKFNGIYVILKDSNKKYKVIKM